MNTNAIDLYFKAGGEFADNVTDKELDLIHRMAKEYEKKGWDERSARTLAVRVGMKVILGHRE